MPRLATLLLLPLVLVLAVVLGLGSYCEAGDDPALAWLFGGVLTGGQPVAAVPLYFRGFGHGLAWLYGAAPGTPWLGLGLGAALLLATVLAFAVLDKLLRPHLRPGPLALALTLFFALAWLEHWLWFSYVRVALLLAGAALLFAAQRPGRRGPLLLGLAGLGAAWLVRPSLAWLALAAVAPAALLLAGGVRRAAPLLLGAALGLALATGGAAAARTPAETYTQTLDGYLARILDFEQLSPRPRSAADRLGTAATAQWLLGDSALTSVAFCRRAYVFEPRSFFGRTVPAKLAERLVLLGRDYFPLLLALAGTALAVGRGRRRWFWLVQAGFGGALLALAGLLKLPPRLALPLLDFWLLNNLVFVLAPAAWAADNRAAAGAQAGAFLRANGSTAPAAFSVPFSSASSSISAPVFAPTFVLPVALVWRRVVLAVGLLTVLLYGAKTWHRHRVLAAEQQRHAACLAALARATPGSIRVLAGTSDWLKSLSPFTSYTPGPGPLLLLSGWPAHDASQARLRRALTGASGQPEALRRLAARPPGAVLWLLGRPEAAWLNQRQPSLRLRPVAAFAPDTAVQFYAPESSPLRRASPPNRICFMRRVSEKERGD